MPARLEPIETSSTPLKSLATAALPRRVHGALERVYALASESLERQLENMLSDFEQQLFKLAEQARNPGLQAGYFETLRRVRLRRTDLVPRFMNGLEAALAGIREPAVPDAESSESISFDELRLVDDTEVSEDSVLRSIALKHESRAGLPLMLLGQRFGVLAGAPAFDAERLPVGPHRLGAILAEAGRVLQIEQEARMLLFHSFNSQVMSGYAQLVEAMNALLARENVLPGLSYVPLRTRPSEQFDDDDGHATPGQPVRDADDDPVGNPMRDLPPSQRPHTRWQGESDNGASNEEENIAFSLLQDLLSSRRELIGKLRHDSGGHDRVPLQTADVVASLGAHQRSSHSRAPGSEGQRPRTVAELKQSLLAQGRQTHGQATRLSSEDEDTFELFGLLYAEIGRELREGAASTALIGRLQVPLLRLALLDRAFFVRSQHPARQLLNAVAEAGAKWLSEDEGDPKLERQLEHAVDHVVEHFDDDAQVFESANHALQSHLQTLARKAELAERRHVEAARGKEKLALAKRRASVVVEESVQGRAMSRFLRNLLDKAWSDVLTLTLLRHGEDSPEWKQQVAATAQIAAASIGETAAPEGLDRHVQQALTHVGYHDDEAGAIARHLTHGRDDSGEDPASRTELAMKLKSRARLGDDGNKTQAKPQSPRNPHEQACYEHLRTLPFGTWMEFVLNQQGDAIRRRIAWFSTVTDHMLFVNQRGQRVDEQSLDHVARLMAQQQAKVVTADRGRLVDRAWQATLNALRNFTGQTAQPQGAMP